MVEHGASCQQCFPTQNVHITQYNQQFWVMPSPALPSPALRTCPPAAGPPLGRRAPWRPYLISWPLGGVPGGAGAWRGGCLEVGSVVWVRVWWGVEGRRRHLVVA
jgi:hypothetical protein